MKVKRADSRGKRQGLPDKTWRVLRCNNWFAGLALGVSLVMSPHTTSALSLAELRSDPKLTPERLLKQFADFKFKLGQEVQKPEVFLRERCGDCDDFATLAADVLRHRGYTPRLVAVFMPDSVHVVCYVNEINGYLDFNHRKDPSPVVRCDGALHAIGESVARSFRGRWLSVSEFAFRDGEKTFLSTEFY
jgi:Transglutaminase-like superfamily